MNLIPETSANNLSTDLAAAVGSGIDSVWVIAVLAISIPLSFYIIKRIMDLFPKRNSGIFYSENGKLHRYKDQELGKNIYDIQTKGYTIFK